MAQESSSPSPAWRLSASEVRRIEGAVRGALIDRTHIRLSVAGPDGNEYRVIVYRQLDLQKIAAERAEAAN